MKLKTLTIVFAFLLLVIIILADANRLGILARVYDFPDGDKVGHIGLYGTLAFLVNLTILRMDGISDVRRKAVNATWMLLLIIALEEWSQRFFHERNSDWRDLLASYFGVAVGVLLAWMISQIIAWVISRNKV